MKKHTKPVFILLFFFLLLSNVIAWEKVTLPNQTTKIKEEEVLVNGQKVKFIHCRSSLSREDIRGFYSRYLPALGWQESCPECNQKQENIIGTFVKVKEKIFITAVPFPLEKGKNFLIIAMSNILDHASSEPDGQQDSSGRDHPLVPRYPGSRRVTVIESDSGKMAQLAYDTTDALDKVLDFYRKNMPDYRWSPELETDFNDLPKELTKQKYGIDLHGQGLIFKGPSGKCIISVIDNPENKDSRIIAVRVLGQA